MKRRGERVLRIGVAVAPMALSSIAVAAPPRPSHAAVAVSTTPRQIGSADAAQVVFLVRTTLVAVDQANVTGNFTVLRDLGAPDFRDRNTAADLARIFAIIRAQHLNVGPAVLLEPHITAATVTPEQLLRIAGWVDTRPAPFNFDMLFRPVGGVWKIEGLSITPLRQGN